MKNIKVLVMVALFMLTLGSVQFAGSVDVYATFESGETGNDEADKILDKMDETANLGWSIAKQVVGVIVFAAIIISGVLVITQGIEGALSQTKGVFNLRNMLVTIAVGLLFIFKALDIYNFLMGLFK